MFQEVLGDPLRLGDQWKTWKIFQDNQELQEHQEFREMKYLLPILLQEEKEDHQASLSKEVSETRRARICVWCSLYL